MKPFLPMLRRFTRAGLLMLATSGLLKAAADPTAAVTLEQAARTTLSTLREPTDIGKLSEAARGGDTRARLSLGLRQLWGIGTPKDETAGIGWLNQAADEGDPSACYFIGSCHLLGLGLPADEQAGRSRHAQAALLGHVRATTISPAAEQARQEWRAKLQVALNPYRLGLTAEAEKLCRENLAAQEAGPLRSGWHAAGTRLAMADLAATSKHWGAACPQHDAALAAGVRAMREFEPLPADVVLPEYFTELVRLELQKVAWSAKPAEVMRLWDRQAEILTSKFGGEHPYLIGQLLGRSNAFADRGLAEPSDRDFRQCLALAKVFLATESRQLRQIWRIRAEAMARSRRPQERLVALAAAHDLYAAEKHFDADYVHLKRELTKARVTHRMTVDATSPRGIELFRRKDELPANVIDLRNFADAGEPTACALLSLGLRSGHYPKAFTSQLVPALGEADIYREASELAFRQSLTASGQPNDESLLRRHARLGNPYAWFHLSRHLQSQQDPWPAEGRHPTPRDTELTAESFALLEASADAGVPEAVRAYAEILFRGHYDQTEPTDELFTPYQGPDRGWLRKVIRDDTQAVVIQRRLKPDPFVVRRNRAKAAGYLRAAFDHDHDDGAAFYLGVLSAKGALSSFEPKRQEIEYPAIPTDPIRAAAYFTIALHGRPSPAGLSARAAEELGRLRLDEGDTAAARRLAAQLLAQRPER